MSRSDRLAVSSRPSSSSSDEGSAASQYALAISCSDGVTAKEPWLQARHRTTCASAVPYALALGRKRSGSVPASVPSARTAYRRWLSPHPDTGHIHDWEPLRFVTLGQSHAH